MSNKVLGLPVLEGPLQLVSPGSLVLYRRVDDSCQCRRLTVCCTFHRYLHQAIIASRPRTLQRALVRAFVLPNACRPRRRGVKFLRSCSLSLIVSPPPSTSSLPPHTHSHLPSNADSTSQLPLIHSLAKRQHEAYPHLHWPGRPRGCPAHLPRPHPRLHFRRFDCRRDLARDGGRALVETRIRMLI